MKQEYDKYKDEDHEVWSIMYDRQMEELPALATNDFMSGMSMAGFEPDRIPEFVKVNERLEKLTGWHVYEVPGIVADDLFFKLLSEQKFPATTWIRKKSEIEYIEEPDMFHDVFGHVPLLTNMQYCHFLLAISQIAAKHIDNPVAVEFMSRLYWFTIEFGLIREEGRLKIYGAGLLSSIGETLYSLQSDVPKRHEFNIAAIMDTPFIKSAFQVEYFIIDSYEQLYNSIPEVEKELELALAKAEKV